MHNANTCSAGGELAEGTSINGLSGNGLCYGNQIYKAYFIFMNV